LQELAEKERREKKRLEKEQREYKGFLNEEDMTSNTSVKAKSMKDYENDFWG
jgi:hypothetical protein